MRRPKKRKSRKLGRLTKIWPGHPAWPPYVKTVGGITHAWTDWDIVIQVSEVETEQFGTITHLWIHDRASSTDWPWYLLQAIKDSVCGQECQAIEVFPRHNELIDAANMRHLWVLPAEYSLPFGLHGALS